MLDLLVAADAAADTPERRQLLDGLLEGNEREMRRALESDVDHGELLADDFFYAFLGLAGLHGDWEIWRLLQEYGYSFATEVKPPPSSNALGAERGAHPMSLAGWLAQFAPIERLKELQEEGLLDPWGPALRVGNGHKTERLSAAELGMLTGSAAHFQYWMDVWRAHGAIEQPLCGPLLPVGLRVAVGMNGLSAQNASKAQGSAVCPGHWPEADELMRRTEAMVEAWTQIHYPATDESERWLAMNRRPPSQKDAQATLDLIVRWQCERTPNPFEKAVEHHALEEESFPWLQALLAHGVPLSRPTHADPMALAHGLALKQDLAQYPPLLACWKIFVERARKECPAALKAFLADPVLPSEKPPGQAQPAVFWAVKRDQTDGVNLFLEWGTPTNIVDAQGKFLGRALLEAMLQDTMGSERRFQAFQSWLEHASAEEKTELWSGPPCQIEPTPGKTENHPQFPEEILIDQDRSKHLVVLLDHGLPLVRPGQWPLGHSILRGASKARFMDSHLWEKFRSRAEADGDSGIPAAVLQEDADSVHHRFRNEEGEAWANLRQQWLDQKLNSSQSGRPSRKARPRL